MIKTIQKHKKINFLKKSNFQTVMNCFPNQLFGILIPISFAFKNYAVWK